MTSRAKLLCPYGVEGCKHRLTRCHCRSFVAKGFVSLSNRVSDLE
jgi:hypothetical protein